MRKVFDGERYFGFVLEAANRAGVYGDALRSYGNAVIEVHQSDRFEVDFARMKAEFSRQSLGIIGLAGGSKGVRDVKIILQALDIAETQSMKEVPTLVERVKGFLIRGKKQR